VTLRDLLISTIHSIEATGNKHLHCTANFTHLTGVPYWRGLCEWRDICSNPPKNRL